MEKGQDQARRKSSRQEPAQAPPPQPETSQRKAPGHEAAQREISRRETSGLTKLGAVSRFNYDTPEKSILESFPNLYPERNYVITFEHPEFTSLCPMTGQPDFGLIRVRYTPGASCVESKSFKLYLGAFRNHGSFMESLTNKIADDLIAVLSPRRMTVEGIFNARGGTHISVRVEHMNSELDVEDAAILARLW